MNNLKLMLKETVNNLVLPVAEWYYTISDQVRYSSLSYRVVNVGYGFAI